MEKKIIISLIIVSVISLLIGFGIGKISEKGNWQAKLTQVQKEIDLLKFQLERVYPPLPEEVFSLSGTVIELGDKFLVMESTIQVSRFPLPEGREMERQAIKVNVTDETEIYQEEKLPTGELPFRRVILSLGDIEVGDSIYVVSNENIKGKKEITASEIRVW